MLICWHPLPSARRTFDKLVVDIREIIRSLEPSHRPVQLNTSYVNAPLDQPYLDPCTCPQPPPSRLSTLDPESLLCAGFRDTPVWWCLCWRLLELIGWGAGRKQSLREQFHNAWWIHCVNPTPPCSPVYLALKTHTFHMFVPFCSALPKAKLVDVKQQTKEQFLWLCCICKFIKCDSQCCTDLVREPMRKYGWL